jgi:hypothetical protein
MVRRVFFSFHYERDIWRASQVRNSWVTKDREANTFLDSASWESLKKQGDEPVKRWIDKQLDGTSVTVVLIGTETSTREFVRYEIRKSYEKKNGLLGVYIHKLKDNEGKPDGQGDNHFGEIGKDDKGNPVYFWQIASTYDYVDNDGYNNLPKWIEEAAQKAGR